MNFRQDKRIERKLSILGGKPVIKGTRITVDFILELLAQGWGVGQILKNYPQLKREDISAALEYSAKALRIQSLYSIKGWNLVKFLADENIPLEVVSFLKKDGVEIESVSVIKPGISDEEILEIANRENKDFW